MSDSLEARPSRSLSTESTELAGRAPGNVEFLFRVDTYLERRNSRLGMPYPINERLFISTTH